jgi:Protein of unknown function, DUF488
MSAVPRHSPLLVERWYGRSRERVQSGFNCAVQTGRWSLVYFSHELRCQRAKSRHSGALIVTGTVGLPARWDQGGPKIVGARNGRSLGGQIMRKEPPTKNVHWPEGTVFTIGHSTLPIDQFISLLQTYRVACVADIRTVPRSRHNPQFNADALAHALKPQNIDYLPMPALGGLRHARKDSSNTGWRNTSFRGYADYMQTGSFAQAVAELIEVSRQKRTAIMCAEAVPWRCHRSLVADALNVRGIPAFDILSESSYRMHKLTPFAHVDGTHITYPSEQPILTS